MLDSFLTIEYQRKLTPCERSLAQYIDALNCLELLKEKVPEEAEAAPGRLLDRFQFLPTEIENTVPLSDEGMEVIKVAATEAVTKIEDARREMDKRGTKYVAKYLPYDLKAELNDRINLIQQDIFLEAVVSIKECICMKKS